MGVIWLIEWAKRAPAWIALIYVTLGREGGFAVFAMFAVFAALSAPSHLEDGGWRRSATISRSLVIAQTVDRLGTGHTVLGILGAVFAVLIALVLLRDSRAKPVPLAAAQPGGHGPEPAASASDQITWSTVAVSRAPPQEPARPSMT